MDITVIDFIIKLNEDNPDNVIMDNIFTLIEDYGEIKSFEIIDKILNLNPFELKEITSLSILAGTLQYKDKLKNRDSFLFKVKKYFVITDYIDIRELAYLE